MKKYILKYPVYNNIDFPAGTTIELLNEEHYNFIVTEGKLKGEKGGVADGLEGWLLDDTIENRKLFKKFEDSKEKLDASRKILIKKWSALPTSIIPSQK